MATLAIPPGGGAPTDSPTFTTKVLTGTQPMIIAPTSDLQNAINFTESDLTTSVMSIDTASRRVGIATKTPAQLMDINGNLNVGGVMGMGVSTASAACLIDMVNPFVGLGVPAMTTTQKNAISPNRAGNVVFDTTLGKLCVNVGSGWQTVTSA